MVNAIDHVCGSKKAFSPARDGVVASETTQALMMRAIAWSQWQKRRRKHEAKQSQNAAKNKKNCALSWPTLASSHQLKGRERFNSRSHLSTYGRREALHFARGRKEEVMWKFLARMLRDESGATAIEYGLIAALISVVIIAALTSVGSSLTSTFGNVANAL
jgi:pilus assembly protein Flp/PilA